MRDSVLEDSHWIPHPLIQPLPLAGICLWQCKYHVSGPSLQPLTFCEASIWVQVLLRLLHRDFFYFWFDINGASFRGASIIQFLDLQEKGRSNDSAAVCPLYTDNSTSGMDDVLAIILLYNFYYKLIQVMTGKQLLQGHRNSVRMGCNIKPHSQKTVIHTDKMWL